ncbi:hypothetical protein MMC14_001904 [Varicellaria rhodocarpa]|nr:hypothetical protein [Varicellaria rhodocarpa]
MARSSFTSRVVERFAKSILNGFCLCLVHENFDPERANYEDAECQIPQDATEFIVLGTAGPPTADPGSEQE